MLQYENHKKNRSPRRLCVQLLTTMNISPFHHIPAKNQNRQIHSYIPFPIRDKKRAAANHFFHHQIHPTCMHPYTPLNNLTTKNQHAPTNRIAARTATEYKTTDI